MKKFIEKLIGRLEDHKKYCEMCHEEFPNAKMSLTYEVQINAYKNAIEIVNQLAEEYKPCTKSSCSNCEVYDKEKHYCPKWCEVIRHTISELAEEYKGGWILCSDRLPTEVMLCWATIEEEQIRFVRKLRYYPMYGEWVHDNGQGISEHAKVIAWMEYNIPAPYEEGE